MNDIDKIQIKECSRSIISASHGAPGDHPLRSGRLVPVAGQAGILRRGLCRRGHPAGAINISAPAPFLEEKAPAIIESH